MSASASESPVRGMDAETRLVGVALQEKSNKKYSKLKVAFDHGKMSGSIYSGSCGTSLLRTPTGLGKIYLNGEVTVIQWVLFTVEYNLGLTKGDRNGEVTLLVR